MMKKQCRMKWNDIGRNGDERIYGMKWRYKKNDRRWTVMEKMMHNKKQTKKP